MPARIPETIRDDAFQSWLAGDSFRTISVKHRIGEGSVDNIISEKKHLHSSEQLTLYRDFGIAMSKSHLTIQQCASGHRIAMILRNMGEEEQSFEEFIAKLGELHRSGLGPESLAKHIDDLHYFLQRNQNMSIAASIPEICNSISLKQAEEKRLENEISLLESKKHGVEKELSEIQLQISNAEAELGLTTEYKEKLQVSGLKKDDLPDCIELGRMVRGYGYSVREISERFSTMKELEDSLVALGNKLTHDAFRYDQLVRENSRLEEINSKNSLRLGQLVSLEEMGFGIAEFKQLRNILTEIAEARNMSTEENAVVKRFIDSLRDHFYDYLDLRKTVQELESKIQELNIQRDHQLVALNLTPDVKEEVDSLVRIGIKKDDIERILEMIRQNQLPCSRSPELKNGDRMPISQPTLATNHTIKRERIKHWPHPPVPKRIGLKIRSRKRSRSGEQNPEIQIYRQGVPSCPEILESSERDKNAVRNPLSEQREKTYFSRNSMQQTNLNPKVKLAEVDVCSFLDNAVRKPEVWKCSQLNEKRNADTQEEVTSLQQPVPPAGKEQTGTERTDRQKEISPWVDDAGAIDFGELIRNIYVKYLT